MACKAPGKHYRKGITSKEFYQLFPDNASAEQWLIAQRWPEGVRCPYCGVDNVQTGSAHKTMPFLCRKSKKRGSCGKRFSVRTDTFMESSPIPYQDWLFAFYLIATNLKGVASMRLQREIKVSQKSAWFMAHRIRKAWDKGQGSVFAGPVECDETYIGGRSRNMHRSQQKCLTGRGGVDKVPVVGVKDRATNQVKAQVVDDTTRETLEGFIRSNVIPGTRIYTDEARAYTHLPNHEAVKHSVGEYVRGQVSTNGVESFWATLKRAQKGTFHRFSPKHLHRYVDEFVGRHNMRTLDTLQQMAEIAQRMVGGRLCYKDLVG